MVAFDENGNRKCKVFIRQFRKSSKLLFKKYQLLSIVGNILLRKKMTVTFPLLVVACDFLLSPSNCGQTRSLQPWSDSVLPTVVRLGPSNRGQTRSLQPWSDSVPPTVVRLGPSNRSQTRLAGACSEAILVAMES